MSTRVVIVALAALTACAGRTRMEWTPSRVSHVPDSTLVRFSTAESRPAGVGRALGWQAGAPRLVLVTGDTVSPPAAATLEVFTGRTRHHAVFGGIIGWLLGVGAVLATCEGDYCGEQDFRPLFGAFLGAMVGSLVKSDRWVKVTPDSLPPPAPGTARENGPSRGGTAPGSG